jgi:hypothetical protein
VGGLCGGVARPEGGAELDIQRILSTVRCGLAYLLWKRPAGIGGVMNRFDRRRRLLELVTGVLVLSVIGAGCGRIEGAPRLRQTPSPLAIGAPGRGGLPSEADVRDIPSPSPLYPTPPGDPPRLYGYVGGGPACAYTGACTRGIHPIEAVIRVTGTGGAEVASLPTDVNGYFVLAVRPGGYTVTASPSNSSGSCSPTTVLATSTEVARVDVFCRTPA